MEISLELIISAAAILISLYTYYSQNVKEEVFVYPVLQDKHYLIKIENTGNSTLRNYMITLRIIDHKHDEVKNQLLKMDIFNKKAKFSLAPKKAHEIIIGGSSYKYENDNLPILEIDVFNSKGKKKDTFVCDFNIYKYRISGFNSNISSKDKMVNSIDEISRSIKNLERNRK